MISMLFGWGITNRIRQLQKNAARPTTGGVRELPPEGLGEIGALSEGVAKTAEVPRHRTVALKKASHGLAEVDAEGRRRIQSGLWRIDRTARRTLGARWVATVHSDDQKRLVTLINDFLDFPKIEAGAVRVENVPFQARETF